MVHGVIFIYMKRSVAPEAFDFIKCSCISCLRNNWYPIIFPLQFLLQLKLDCVIQCPSHFYHFNSECYIIIPQSKVRSNLDLQLWIVEGYQTRISRFYHYREITLDCCGIWNGGHDQWTYLYGVNLWAISERSSCINIENERSRVHCYLQGLIQIAHRELEFFFT